MDDPVGHHIVRQLRDLGYVLQIELNRDGTCTMWATHESTGERFIATAEGEGLKTLVVLCGMVGLDLEG